MNLLLYEDPPLRNPMFPALNSPGQKAQHLQFVELESCFPRTSASHPETFPIALELPPSFKRCTMYIIPIANGMKPGEER